MKRLSLWLVVAGLSQTACVSKLLSDCNIGGTGQLDVVDGVVVSTAQIEVRGPIEVQFLPYANETDPHSVVLTLPQDLYVGLRSSTRFSVQDTPLDPSLVFARGVVDFEVMSQAARLDALGAARTTYQVKFTGFGADDNYTHFQGTCPVESH